MAAINRGSSSKAYGLGSTPAIKVKKRIKKVATPETAQPSLLKLSSKRLTKTMAQRDTTKRK